MLLGLHNPQHFTVRPVRQLTHRGRTTRTLYIGDTATAAGISAGREHGTQDFGGPLYKEWATMNGIRRKAVFNLQSPNPLFPRAVRSAIFRFQISFLGCIGYIWPNPCAALIQISTMRCSFATGV